MTSKSSLQLRDRPRRFALHLPVYFRKLDSPTWLEGRTENISCTGMLLHSSSHIAPETTLDMRLQVALGSKGKGATEIHCKCTVVRLEQRIVPENPIALAVAIRDYRIVGRH
ncbi:MAG: PilZ domain-containing protein [Terriglobia bacterium]